jgi:acyl-CoA dehydrogenase
MIGFDLTPEQEKWRDKARRFAEEDIAPVAWDIDKGIYDGFHWPLIRRMAEEGLFSLGVPQAYGGSGLDIMTMCLVIEELATADPGIAFTATLNSYVPLVIAGTEEQKRTFFPLTCDPSNPGLAAFALTEPNAGSDAAAVATTARPDGDEYVLNGEKCFISNGDMASLYTVFATVDRHSGVRGITAFLVPGDTPGLSRGKIEAKMGFKSNHTGVFALNDVRVPAANRLGREGDGFGIAMKILEVLRIVSCGAVGVGLARGAHEATLKFFAEKSTPKTILNQQALAFPLADMLAMVEAARLLVWKTAWLLDNGRQAGTMSGLTKFFASDAALAVAEEGLRLVGPHGYTRDYPLEKCVREAKLLQIYEGTNQISRLVASRGVFSH